MSGTGDYYVLVRVYNHYYINNILSIRLAFYWSSFSGIEYATNCKFVTDGPEWIETNKTFINCLRQLRTSDDFTHYNWKEKEQTCLLKKGYVNKHQVIFVKEKSACALHPAKISTNILPEKKINNFQVFNNFSDFLSGN